MDIGLNVDYDGKKNIVMEGEIVKDYPIGGMICEYARFRPTELKPIILENPYFHYTDLKKNGADALMSFYKTMLDKFGVVTAVMVVTDFLALMSDFTQASEEELKKLLGYLNDDKEESLIKRFILEDTEFDEFGINNIGQALLSAYATYGDFYVAFKHSFNMLVSGNEYEEEQVMNFLSLYGLDVDYQHIDFRIMLFEGSFHSVYTIKSSLSLILFEAAHAIDANTKFVKCKNCDNYFVPVGRSDSVYCSYPSPQDKAKACRDVGANATRARKMKNDILTQEYRRLYMRLKMAIKRHPENTNLQEKLLELTEGMKARRKKREEGKLSTDAILEWIASLDNLSK